MSSLSTASRDAITMLKNYQALDQEVKVRVQEVVDLLTTSHGVIKNRRFRLKSYPSCFIGSQAVDLIVNEKYATSREEATKILQYALEADMFHHVVDEHEFEDGYLFYRMRMNDDPALGPSVSSLAENYFKAGMVDVKVSSSSTKQRFVVVGKDKKLYTFLNGMSSSPKLVASLDCCSGGDISYCGKCSQESYCLNIILPTDEGVKATRMVICVNSAAEQESWLGALVNGGLVFNEVEEASSADQGNNLYDFSALSIDKELINFNSLVGKVCVIVNVASF